MITINEDQWDDIKRDFLSTIEHEFTEEPLIYFDHKKNEQQEIGFRETYEFTKNEMDYRVIMDKEYRLSKTTTEKDGRQKDHYSRSADEFTYKLSVKFRDEKDGTWKDSAAMESNFENE